jgi:O-antigen/teichoic acid export membrane protein
MAAMKIPYRSLSLDVLQLGSGELLGRLGSITVVILLGHWYGVLILGVYALATTVSQCLQPLIDFGLRHVGARLLARHPESGGEIVRRVQRRRLLMASMVLPFLFAYVALTNLPIEMKAFLFGFSVISAFYAISLEWAAWGKAQLHLVGIARSVIPLSILFSLAIGRGLRGHILVWLMAGNAAGYAMQVTIFWGWWKRQDAGAGSSNIEAIAESLAWRRTSLMGIAWLGNLAFNSIDMLMLGVMSSPEQVGFYSAAYRVLNQVLVTYYLLTQALYPRFARQSAANRRRMLRSRILLPLLGAGVAIAALVAVSRRPVMAILFGHQFLMASPLLLLLAWAIPLDFLTSYLSNAYIAWGMEKKILLCTAVAAGSNAMLNLVSIPTYGATAAAVNTLIAYAIFLVGLAVAGRSVTAMVRQAGPEAELTV